MSGIVFSLAAAMFGIPLLLMTAIAVTGADIPAMLLSTGGWTMAFGVIVGGIGAVMAAGEM